MDEKVPDNYKPISAFETIVVNRLNTIDKKLDNHSEEHIAMRSDITNLKAKSSLWGAIGGGFSTLLAYFWMGHGK